MFQQDGVTQIIDANTGDGMFGLDPNTGKMLWNLKVFEMRVCSTPLIAGDIAIVSRQRRRRESSGRRSDSNQARARSPSRSIASTAARLTCRRPCCVAIACTWLTTRESLRASTFKPVKSLWMERVGGRQGFGASPIVVGDKLLVISLEGEATVLRASDQFEKLGEVDLGGPVGATPAFAEGRLVVPGR